jgi:acyl dehydratase
MALDYPAILDVGMRGQPLQYDERDVMLYALAVGMGADPLTRNELDFVYEKNLQVVPSFASAVAWHAGLSTQQLGLDYRRVLHAEEEIVLHRPLATSAKLLADTSIKAVYDKGRDKGAIVVREAKLIDAVDSQLVATVHKTLFAKGDGGCGGGAGEPLRAPVMPARVADVSLQMPTRAAQALLYRLCGDRNPLHADPDAARAAGFDRPILHGLCTYGIVCRAILRAFCAYDTSRIYSQSARFSAPVYPGDVLTVDLWREDSVILFEARVVERNVKVITHGRAVLKKEAA